MGCFYGEPEDESGLVQCTVKHAGTAGRTAWPGTENNIAQEAPAVNKKTLNNKIK
jgi:hypothetical protein